MKEAAISSKAQLAEYRAVWYRGVPAERQAIVKRHIGRLRSDAIAQTMLKAGDRAAVIVLGNAKRETLDAGTLLQNGPVIVTFYRGGWCPYCKRDLKAFQEVPPEIAAVDASLVAITPGKPDDALSTAEKNALTFEGLSDVGQKVGRARVYEFTDELKSAYRAFGLEIPAPKGAPGARAVSATYAIDRGDHLRLRGCRLSRSRRSPRRPQRS
jgi:peroxiredoxin